MQTGVGLARPSALLRQHIARAIANIHHPSTYEERSVRHQLKCLRGLLPHLWKNIESGARKVKVHAADGRILMADHDLVGLPGQQAPVHRISVVVRRDADPITRLEADVLTLWRPILRLARLRFP